MYGLDSGTGSERVVNVDREELFMKIGDRVRVKNTGMVPFSGMEGVVKDIFPDMCVVRFPIDGEVIKGRLWPLSQGEVEVIRDK